MNQELRKVCGYVKAYIELEKAAGMDEHMSNVTLIRHAKSAKNDGALGGLESLKSELASCTACDLYKTRRNLVFGSGSPKARLMFVGEAPGEDEDLQGLPFVGRAGQLLTKIIEAMGMKRGDVYIANILKCRPPNNRPPLPTEILACEENLKQQIAQIQPKVICTLGKFASQTLLRTQTPITGLRGKFADYNGIKVMPTYHPAYLLRNPSEKRMVWEDMKKVMKELCLDSRK